MRGELYWATFEPRSGTEQRGRRPAVIVSHDGFNDVPTWRSVLVVPLSTSGAQARRGRTAIPIPVGTTGLTRPSVALCHQVTALDRTKLGPRIGVLPPALLRAIETGLMHALDL
ncbi:MAG: type II toxin-antitoxin system PemK/MazF family toxin [Trueperaceae bacterium]|nr:type II toxin-antitoxin system PemK/MazF family toxin [Trueperaceae bacterium]